MGVGVTRAHRAISDVLTLQQCLSRLDRLEARLQLARERQMTTEYEADVVYANRYLAKEEGFHWHSERRQWLRWLSEKEVGDGLVKFPFEVKPTGNTRPY